MGTAGLTVVGILLAILQVSGFVTSEEPTLHVEHYQGGQNHQHQHTEVDYANNIESATDQQVPILEFPKPAEGLRRRKREWVIPAITFIENDRGPYPLKVTQIRSNADNVKKIFYSITGEGADHPPIGLFTMDRNTGILYVTQPVDREEKDRYMCQVHAVADSSGNVEAPMDVIVKVIDQNDNKPTFAQDIFLGEVAEATPIGFEVIKVVATDLDQPNTDNSDIRYRLISQEPALPSDLMFAINPVTGVIRVNAGGLDREKYPMYTLVVQAADTMGEGLIGKAKVILNVTDSNNNAPAFSQPLVPILEFPKPAEGLRRRKGQCVVPDFNVVENDRGPYPLKVTQIRFDADQVKKIFYSITGEGADHPPIGLFTVDRNTGILYVTKPVDREEKDRYMFQVHAVADSSGNAEDTMEIKVKVIDQNDNKPTFAKTSFWEKLLRPHQQVLR
ncbi:cadherin-1-like isoform X2 [Etheostoma cragini]|uniref:cadherin-1-like isoform X2 n=1 Tax=Etheostoma cragini TaxID=417921 RepID=UPI00155F2AFB|nr:cadherin-1-like isoform X2 [Etheostoma cragini]